MITTKITIGFTGHIDLRDEDVSIIKIRIREKIQQLLQEHSGKQIEIISGNAKGADELLREIVDELKAPNLVHKKILQKEESKEKKHVYYQRLADTILKNSEVVIAVWNGIFNHKPSGTSDIVKKALENGLTIHHLITPRLSNHFPVNSLAKSAIDYNARQFSRIPFTVNFTWHIEKPNAKTEPPKQRVYDEHTTPLIFNYFIPIGLVLVTLILGWFGFNEHEAGEGVLNNLFKAANLITLNNSALNQPSNTILDVARCFGLITLVYAFAYALFLAFGRHRDSFIRRLWKKKKFVLVLGLNEKSINLIKSLTQKKERVVLLTEYEDSIYDNELKRLKNLVTVKGSFSSATMLEYVYAVSAKEIYIVSDNDSKNVRAAQELDILLKDKESDMPKIYVHLLNDEHNNFLRDSLKNISNHTTLFDIYENIVRRLFLHFPPDRFYQSPDSDVLHAVIIGFDEMGKALLLNLLKQGHYQKDKKVKITVYCNQAEDCQRNFQNQNPLVFTNNKDFTALKEIKEEIWQNISLSFIELPQSDAEWLDDNQALYKGLDRKQIVTVYTGLDNGIFAASYLKSVLPKLNERKKKTGCDIQVFCYYNFPDRKEEAHIENYLNELAPKLFVKCFGNFVDECEIDSVKSMALDELAKLINAFYSQSKMAREKIFQTPVRQWQGFSEDETDRPWSGLSTRHKMSSQQAGDHLWAKLRILFSMKGWNFDVLHYSLDKQTDLPILAEIEHRRWSAEQLLQGCVPFDLVTGSDEYIENAIKWNDQEEGISEEEAEKRKAFRKEKQLTKRHIDLVPFKDLYENEAKKDYNQIEAMPYFLKQMLPLDSPKQMLF